MSEDHAKQSPRKVFAAHKLAGWTLRLERKSSSPNGSKRSTQTVSCSPPTSLPAPLAGRTQDHPLAAELSAFGLATQPDACKLWGIGTETTSDATVSTDQPGAAAHKALWIYMGAVSAARLSASVLMDSRWVRALLEVMEQQGAVLRNLYSQQKGSKAAKRSAAELMEFLGSHRAAAQDCLEPGKKLDAEAAVYLCANLDALYYDLLQYYLRRGGEGPAVPPPHEYFPAVAAKHPGNRAACQRLLANGIGKAVRSSLMESWGLVEEAGQITLPEESVSANPLLAVMWSRFQEGCRLLPELDSGMSTSKRLAAEQGADAPGHRRLRDGEVLDDGLSQQGSRETLDISDFSNTKRRKLEGGGAVGGSPPSSEDSSDADARDTESSGSDSDGETAPAGGQPKAWPGHPALRAWRESSKECHFYAYVPPTVAALDALAARAPLVEVGAGLGFWAELLRRRGVRVTAYDSHPPSPQSHAPNEYHGFVPAIFRPGVVQGGPKNLGSNGDHSLFLCYPPPESSMALDCLRHFRGSCVCVVGEWAGDTGDAAFTAALLAGFALAQRVPLPNWSDTAHELTVWERKSGLTAGPGKQRKGRGLPAQARHPTGVTSTDAQQEVPIACCAGCSSPHATSDSSRGGPCLRRCRWCKDVAYCSEPCSQQDAARHKQLHLLRWVNLEGSQPQWGCKLDYEPLLL